MLRSLAILILGSVTVFADNAKLQIGLVDLQRALQSVEAGKSAKSSLEKEVQAKKAEIEKKQQAFQKEAESFEKKQALLNDTEKTKQQAELQKKFVELQKNAQESQLNLQNRERELTQPILAQLKDITEAISKEKELSLVVEKNESGVLYAQNGSDLTDAVIERYNSKNKSKKK